jgi:site-specific recombinase XerD
MNRARRPPLSPCLAPVFDRALDSLGAALSPDTARHYRGTVRNFLSYLGAAHPEVNSVEQLRRQPHILGWMSRLRSQAPPLMTESYINLLIALRATFTELAWAHQLPQLAHLIRREDIPHLPQRLPRPLTAEQDQLLQQEFVHRNDLGGNAFLLIRHTGMRIGECVDLSYDCLRSTGANQWAVHVPLGKLKTERMVPVDSLVVELIQRLRFFRSLDPLPPDGRLLARPSSKEALVRQLRDYMHQVCHALGLSIRIVPHQFRHTYATEMLRAGVSFPVLMKLLGHTSPDMTILYVEVALNDLQREFQQARSKPRYLIPQPKTSLTPIRAGLDGVIDSLQAAQHALEMFRRALPRGTAPAASTGYLIASPKSPLGPANSAHLENGQRLAGYVGNPEVI